MLAYISDHNFVRTATLPYREEAQQQPLQLASLNHAMWIHRDFDLNSWLLYQVHSSVAAGQRALVVGHMYTRAGQLVATVVQEGLMRFLDNNHSKSSFSENS